MGTPNTFTPVFRGGNGIGGYDLESSADRTFAFDYDHSGKADHLALYRPAKGAIWILRNDNGNFTPVYRGSNGIGGFDLQSNADRALSFDYDHSGKLDYIVLYRPGKGAIWIVRNDRGTFIPVYQGGNGIGGYDLQSTSDRIFPFDYDHSGKLDHIVLYRSGKGAIWILRNDNGNFTPVYRGSNGIGGFDLQSPADLAFAFDYDHSGKLDHIVLYRPGKGAIWIVRNDRGTFIPVYQGGNGIGGYDLQSTSDRVLPFDYDHSGKLDHIILYRPGKGAIWILRNDSGDFIPLYQGGSGIGGYDLQSPADRAIEFDYHHSGKPDHLILYRPAKGAVWILRNDASE